MASPVIPIWGEFSECELTLAHDFARTCEAGVKREGQAYTGLKNAPEFTIC